MKHKVIWKLQFLLFQNYLYHYLLWDFIIPLTNSYVPLLNLPPLEWRERHLQTTVSHVPGSCRALFVSWPSSPLDRQTCGMGTVNLQTQQRHYEGHKIHFILVKQWHFSHLSKTMIRELMNIRRIFWAQIRR